MCDPTGRSTPAADFQESFDPLIQTRARNEIELEVVKKTCKREVSLNTGQHFQAFKTKEDFFRQREIHTTSTQRKLWKFICRCVTCVAVEQT